MPTAISKDMDRSSLLPFTASTDALEERGGGLCGCFSDWNSCLWGYCCPCYLFGRTAQRAGVTNYTLTGCMVYFVFGAILPGAIALSLFMHFMHGMGDYNDCVKQHQVYPGPSPADGGSAADGSAGSGLVPKAFTGCDTLLWDALAVYYRNLFLVDLFLFTVFGVLCGYYRQKIYAALGGAGTSWKSFVLHCCPCTHLCAMCQEARAVDTATKAGGAYTGLQV